MTVNFFHKPVLWLALEIDRIFRANRVYCFLVVTVELLPTLDRQAEKPDVPVPQFTSDRYVESAVTKRLQWSDRAIEGEPE